MSRKPRIACAISAVFALALVMGAGPGLSLVNQPTFVDLPFGLSLPRIYAWGLLWYFVEALCVVAAYFLLWRDSEDDGQNDTEHDGRSNGVTATGEAAARER